MNENAALRIAVELQLAKFQKQYAQLQKLLGNPKAFKSAGDMITGQIIKIDTQMRKLDKTLMPRQTPFAGYALSIMFAGMAIQRTFKSISDSGLKTFQDISHSVYGAVTNTDMLQGSMTYLSYTIGAALEPLIGFLIPFVDLLSDWIDKNPTLVAEIITVGTVLGGLMLVGGGLKLAIDGFTNLKNILFNSDWSGQGAVISKALSLGIGAVGVYFTFKAAADAFDAFKSGDTTKGVIEAISAGFSTIGTVMALKGKTGAGAALITIGIAFNLLGQDELFQTIFSLWGTVMGIISGLVYAGLLALMKWIDDRFNNSVFSEITGIKSNLGSASHGFTKDFQSGFDLMYNNALSAGAYYDQQIKQAKANAAASRNASNGATAWNGPSITINGPVVVSSPKNWDDFANGIFNSFGVRV